MADRRYPPGLQHGYGIYDFLVNVPFSVSGPGIAKGLKINTVASHVDIAPTILELAGAPVPEEMAGRSLLPVLSGGSLQDRPVYMEACGIVIPSEDDWLKGVRTDEWKYIYAPRNKKIEELLFNLKEDPEESINLAGKMPQVVEKMRGLLKEIDQENEQRLKAGSFEDEQTKALEDKLRSLGYM